MNSSATNFAAFFFARPCSLLFSSGRIFSLMNVHGKTSHCAASCTMLILYHLKENFLYSGLKKKNYTPSIEHNLHLSLYYIALHLFHFIIFCSILLYYFHWSKHYKLNSYLSHFFGACFTLSVQKLCYFSTSQNILQQTP